MPYNQTIPKAKEQKPKRLSIYDIKRLTADTEPYFFNSKTMKFFGQRLSDYSVNKIDNTHYKIVAPMRDRGTGKTMGYTKRIFNTETRKLESTE